MPGVYQVLPTGNGNDDDLVRSAVAVPPDLGTYQKDSNDEVITDSPVNALKGAPLDHSAKTMTKTLVNTPVKPNYLPHTPSRLHWHKSPSQAFTDRQRRARRRSSLCYSETAHSGDNSEDDDISASLNTTERSGSPKRQNKSHHQFELSRPDFKVCSDCRHHILNTSPLGSSTSPPRPALPLFSNKRRTSYADSHKESLVGTYEESLLSGRMSAPSSPPVSFHVKLGALGYGDKCPAKLKFPKHLSTCFDAVFYDYDLHETGTLGRGSPYVGMIDLEEHYLKKRENKAASTKFPGYRIPRKGQIQIVISNLQKTAVKLFLIPYNLSELNPKEKIFIRQKVYMQDQSKQSGGKALFQAVHLQVASPSKGKYYLYGDIRLVFQNRASNIDASTLVPSQTAPNTSEGLKDRSSSSSSTYLGISRNRDSLRVETVSGGCGPLNMNKASPQQITKKASQDFESPSTPTRDSATCIRCQSPIEVKLDKEEPNLGATIKPLATDGTAARVIMTREELKAEMLTDLKASSLDSARP